MMLYICSSDFFHIYMNACIVGILSNYVHLAWIQKQHADTLYRLYITFRTTANLNTRGPSSG